MKNQASAPCKEILPKELRKPGGRHDSLPAARPAAFTAQGKLVLKEGELDITTAPAPAQIPAAEWVTLVMLEADRSDHVGLGFSSFQNESADRQKQSRGLP